MSTPPAPLSASTTSRRPLASGSTASQTIATGQQLLLVGTDVHARPDRARVGVEIERRRVGGAAGIERRAPWLQVKITARCHEES